MWALYFSSHEALIQWQNNVGPSSAVLAQHYADSVQRMCLLLRGWFRAGQCNIILAHNLTVIT